MKVVPSIRLFVDNSIVTLIKPFLDNNLFVVHEDFHGETVGYTISIDELKTKFNLSKKEINEILIQLDDKYENTK